MEVQKPTIVDFVNAQHNHSGGTSGGGTCGYASSAGNAGTASLATQASSASYCGTAQVVLTGGTSGGGVSFSYFGTSGTVASNCGFLVDTSTAALTLTLPSPAVGDQIVIKDYAGNFAVKTLTVGRGTSNIMGSAADLSVDVNNVTLWMVYSGPTKGWLI